MNMRMHVSTTSYRVALANILRRSRVNQSRVLPRRRTACGRCVYSWLRASAVASEEAGVSSTEAANGLDEIGLDVLTPRRSFNRLIKG